MREALATPVTDSCQDILDRFFARDQSYRTISDELEIPSGTIASRIARCLTGQTREPELEGRNEHPGGVWGSDDRPPTMKSASAYSSALLRPAPTGWVLAAQELPAARRTLDDLVARAESDRRIPRSPPRGSRAGARRRRASSPTDALSTSSASACDRAERDGRCGVWPPYCPIPCRTVTPTRRTPARPRCPPGACRRTRSSGSPALRLARASHARVGARRLDRERASASASSTPESTRRIRSSASSRAPS